VKVFVATFRKKFFFISPHVILAVTLLRVELNAILCGNRFVVLQ